MPKSTITVTFDHNSLAKNSSSSQRGQITLFFALSILMIITLIAFVINLGLFVKAKINLQNAVDAAAWAGAATQSRQLTDIAYLNWEMRNVYKEWMFKYYVLGNLSARGVQSPGTKGNNLDIAKGTGMDFTLGPSASKDAYNFPTVCIHSRARSNDNDVCSVYTIPGLPRLTSPGFNTIDETTSVITDILSGRKATDCSARTQANFNLLLAWIYGTGVKEKTEELLLNTQKIGVDQAGAWVRAMELAFRIRNIEYMINVPAHQEGICKFDGIEGCTTNIGALEDEGSPRNERTVKAFYSAYRNLGNDVDREMKESFVLTEIPPTEVRSSASNSLNNILIPSSAPQGTSKFYVDLKLNLVNLVTFYSMFAVGSKNANESPFQTGIESECQMVKVAIPVPGYPMGFDKNPEVLTYYAVKGEASFVGLFNPFNKPIKLTAFAAAKPFGARIGPQLFGTTTEEKSVKVRTNPPFRTYPYLFGLKLDPSISISQTGNVNSIQDTSMKNIPPIIPNDNEFYVTSQEDNVGGSDDADKMRYSIPNLQYDPPNLNQNTYPSPLFVMQAAPPPLNNPEILSAGLYDIDQFKSFFNNISLTQEVSGEDVKNAILNVRSPTRYEQANYLIPTSNQINNIVEVDSFGLVFDSNGEAQIYAPLFGDRLLYENANDINEEIQTYLVTQKPSIEKYITTLKNIATTFRKMKTQSSTDTQGKIYEEAANIIHDDVPDPSGLTCNSMAGRFQHFFLGTAAKAGCPEPLPVTLNELYVAALQGSSQDGRINRQFHNFPLGFKGNNSKLELLNNFSAYFPGALTGGGTLTTGSINKIIGRETLSRRNFYSTKFIPLSSLTNGGNGLFINDASIYKEGGSDGIKGVKNTLQLEQVFSGSQSDIFQ